MMRRTRAVMTTYGRRWCSPLLLAPSSGLRNSLAGRSRAVSSKFKETSSQPPLRKTTGDLHRPAALTTIGAVAPDTTAHSTRRRLLTPPVLPSTTDDAEAQDASATSDAAETAAAPSAREPAPLTNPFRGLHDFISRSYRLDQLEDGASPADLLLARQEKKSGAFSFLRFASGPGVYESHWGMLPELQSQYATQLFGTAGARARRGDGAAPELPRFTDDLGFDSPVVANRYPLLLAQRLLLFPDHMRCFHALVGRSNVPCDFFADVDLPNESPQSAEKILLEMLNYLEVRLPGVGFAQPFFLVLTNEVPSKDKVSYHIHARSLAPADAHGAADDEADDAGATADADSAAATAGGAGKRRHGARPARSKNAKTAAARKVIAFQDYRTVKLLADEVNQTLGRNVIDEQCYRVHGMLRTAFSTKLRSSQEHSFTPGANAAAHKSRLVPMLKATDPALQVKLDAMAAVLQTMTAPEVMELSFCTRHLDSTESMRLVHEHLLHTLPADARGAQRKRNAALLQSAVRHNFRLIRPKHVLGPLGAQAQEFDAYGNVVSAYLTEGAKWRRYKSVIAKLRGVPPRAAESYDVWVRVGLALHNFSNEDHVFEEWVRYSLQCPQKYAREVCRKKWLQFERNPDALNWRRGFNYLNSTLWRQV